MDWMLETVLVCLTESSLADLMADVFDYEKETMSVDWSVPLWEIVMGLLKAGRKVLWREKIL
eukprot:scaffold16354_cov18-Cyclotella_meneghiniana.AAC.1